MRITIEFLQDVINSLRSEPIFIQIISGILLFFVVMFIVRFLIPAISVGFQYDADNSTTAIQQAHERHRHHTYLREK